MKALVARVNNHFAAKLFTQISREYRAKIGNTCNTSVGQVAYFCIFQVGSKSLILGSKLFKKS